MKTPEEGSHEQRPAEPWSTEDEPQTAADDVPPPNDAFAGPPPNMAPPGFTDPSWMPWHTTGAGAPSYPVGSGGIDDETGAPPPFTQAPPQQIPPPPESFGQFVGGPSSSAQAATAEPSPLPEAAPSSGESQAEPISQPDRPTTETGSHARPWTPMDEPWRVQSPTRRRHVKPMIVTAAAMVVAVLVGIGAYALLFAGGDSDYSDLPPAMRADRLFALDPQGRPDGRIHVLTSVGTFGNTIVATGSELGGGYHRGQFLTSIDGARTWQLARVRAADGDEPAMGEIPRHVAGGQGTWVALGGTATSTAIWTSQDARTWTRQPDRAASAFGPKDHVTALARTGSGFVAVGESSPSGGYRDSQGVLWSTRNGSSWQRFTPDQLGMAGVIRLDQVATNGDVIVVHGMTKDDNDFWRSTDGGRTWGVAPNPDRKSCGATAGLTAGRSGFFVACEAKRKTGKKTTGYVVIFNSVDGAGWEAVGEARPGDYKRLGRIRGSADGLTILTHTQKGDTAVLRSIDGRVWQRASTVAGGKDKVLVDVATFPTGAIVVGQYRASGYMATIGVPHGVVDLTKIPNVVHPGHTVTALAQNGGQTIAVGSTNGDAAVWTSRDSRSWNRAQPIGGAFKGSDTQQLTDVSTGPQGWVAVGHSGDDAAKALVLMSTDGATWRKAPDGFQGVPEAVAYGPAGYVMVGRLKQSGRDSAAVTWYSTDLNGWNRGAGAGTNDLGESKWIRDVTATSDEYIAVGDQTKDNVSQPMAWISTDGKKWAVLPSSPSLPSGATSGSLTQVASRGTTLVALGTATLNNKTTQFAAVSTDQGKSWQPQALAATMLTSVTATAKGFIVTGTIGTPGRSDVVLWTSADGRVWQQIRPRGFGLNGRGEQRLTAAIAVGDELLAVGVTSDYQADSPTLWRARLP